MGVFRRVSDIVASNVNDMLDRAENPEKMMKQVIREMEEAVQSARRNTAQAMASHRRLEKELETNSAASSGTVSSPVSLRSTPVRVSGPFRFQPSKVPYPAMNPRPWACSTENVTSGGDWRVLAGVRTTENGWRERQIR